MNIKSSQLKSIQDKIRIEICKRFFEPTIQELQDLYDHISNERFHLRLNSLKTLEKMDAQIMNDALGYKLKKIKKAIAGVYKQERQFITSLNEIYSTSTNESK